MSDTRAATKRYGNTRATREDWLALAMEVLVTEGVENVRILALADRLQVSRSSFYWYYKNRRELLDTLLGAWRASNTAVILRQTALPAKTITGAVCNLFRCFVNQTTFDHQLDFAIREWGRRSQRVREVVEASDTARLEAIRAMFERYGYEPREATMRARVLYYMQIGYYALELKESLEARLDLVPEYLEGFTGRNPRTDELEEFMAFASSLVEVRGRQHYLRLIGQQCEEAR